MNVLVPMLDAMISGRPDLDWSQMDLGDDPSAAMNTVIAAYERIYAEPDLRRRVAVEALRRAVAATDPPEVVRDAVRVALQHEAGLSDALATEVAADAAPQAGEARDHFARVVHRRLREWWISVTDEHVVDNDIDAWNEHFGGWLASFGGPPGQTAGDAIRSDSASLAAWVAEHGGPAGVLWSLWTRCDPPPSAATVPQLRAVYQAMMPAAAFLAIVLWRREVAPSLLAEREARAEAARRLAANPGALVTAVHARIGDALSRPPWDVTDEDLTVPLLPTSTLDKLDRKMLNALGTLQGHRLVRWLITAANEGWHLGAQGPTEITRGVTVRRGVVGVDITVAGGVQALAAALGDRSAKSHQVYEDVLRILSKTTINWEHGDRFGGGSLILFAADRAVGQRRAELRMTVNRPLLPGAYQHLPPHERVLVPVLPVPATYAPRNAAHLARLDWLAVRYLTENRREAVAHGGVVMPWERLADQAGLSRDALHRAVDLWTSDEPEPARWERVSTLRWMLSGRPPYLPARRFLLEGAERSEDRARGGRHAAAARAAKKRS